MCRRSSLSLINREEVERIATTRPYSSTMAAASLASPTAMSMFQNGPPPPYSGWSGPPAHPSSGLMSPPESRRALDGKPEQPPTPLPSAPPPLRLSLPSIHEALSNGGPKPNPYASTIPTSLPPARHQPPYPQAPPPAVPGYATEHASQFAPPPPRRPSPPQPGHTHSRSFSRTESIPATFPESRHSSGATSLQTAPGPPPNPYAAPRYEQVPRAVERTNGYSHYPPTSQQPPYHDGPRPGHVYAHGHSGPTYDQPRHQQRDGREPTDSWKVKEGYKTEPPEFSHGLKRHLDVWDFENNLAQVRRDD
jgi:hypothetical protein